MKTPLAENQLIRADFLPATARVKKFEPRAGYYLLEVTLDGTGEYRPLRLTDEQLAQVEVVSAGATVEAGDPEAFFLQIEANRLRLAYQFDPMLAVSVSQVDPLPHQVEAVYHHALEMPRMRFLIADDPGAGKTVMAGLILKEMQYRGLVKRVLIVAPGHLKYQWQREMKEKFGTSFRLVDRGVIRAHWGENVWEEFPLSIASLDFLKQDDLKAMLKGSQWDLIIVDEAHKMAAYAYEGKERTKIDKTARYQLGEVLSRQSDHLLFLTATPHRGDEENFRLFLDLLRPGFFARKDLLKESVERKENPLFIRRLKEDMRTFDGELIFPPRHVRTVAFKLTDNEMELYNAVTSYVQNYYDQAKANRNIAFAMMILQRRLSSSTHAILRSLQRRRERLEELLRLPDKIRGDAEYEAARRMNPEDLEDLSEQERWEIEERLEHLTIAQNIGDVHAEIDQLDGLIAQAETVKAAGEESKLAKLKDDVLGQLDGRKLLVFTEHKDTLTYLEEQFRAWGYSVGTIHGGMDLDARIEAERAFRNDHQVLVATEAAGEGINLQFCSWMVNYDIPWNPNRLEQRMGRIHRYGQDREVFIWNLVARGTREGQILERLFEKLELMKDALGTDRVFDIINEIIPGTDLGQLLKEAVFSQRRMEEIEHVIEQVDEAHTGEVLERVFMSSLATRHIDYTGLLREQLEAAENRLVPEYVGDFFLRAIQRLGGRFTPVEGGYRVDAVPAECRDLNQDPDFRTRYGSVHREYRRITFEKDVARKDTTFEFVAPGHPLLEAVNEIVLRRFGEPGAGVAAFADPTVGREGALWFAEGVVRDGTGQPAGRRVFALFQRPDGTVEATNPAVLWDLEPAPDADLPESVRALVGDRSGIEDYLIGEVLLPYREEIAARRDHDAEIKERYGLRSLDVLVQESNGKIMEYEARQDAGDDVALPLGNEQRVLEKLRRRKEELEREIRLERNVIVDEPRVLGVAALVPMPVAAGGNEEEPEGEGGASDLPMTRDDEIELVGMRVATEYEEAQGWTVEDVSAAKHGGFDLRSTCINEDGVIEGVRYIEVKARARTGAIRITRNEWMKARKYGEHYWLYVVTAAASDAPTLTRIADPASRFVEGEDIFATGFEIPEKKWRAQENPEPWIWIPQTVQDAERMLLAVYLPPERPLNGASEHQIRLEDRLADLIRDFRTFPEDPVREVSDRFPGIERWLPHGREIEPEEIVQALIHGTDHMMSLTNKIDWERESLQAQPLTPDLRESLAEYHFGEWLASL
ncbi:MAG: helicase-related protein [Rhodothermales bacterium]